MHSFDFKEWADEFSTNLVKEIFRVISSKSLHENPAAVRYVACAVLHKFIGSILWQTLNEKPKLKTSRKDHSKYIMDNFAEIKVAVQESVARAFQVSMTNFSGQDLDYYCQIKVVPKPLSEVAN